MVQPNPSPAPRRDASRARLRACLAGLCLATLTVQAQPAGKAARPDPLDPDASVPALRYASSLATLRRPGDDKPIAWRDANDNVARIGGWRVYTRQAQQPDPLPAAPAGHAGHKSP